MTAVNVPASRGRVRAAIAREIGYARGRGVTVSPASTTICFVLADQIDSIERNGDDRYLLPQLVARLLEERRAASLLPEKPPEAADDVWTALSAELSAAMGDTPPS